MSATNVKVGLAKPYPRRSFGPAFCNPRLCNEFFRATHVVRSICACLLF